MKKIFWWGLGLVVPLCLLGVGFFFWWQQKTSESFKPQAAAAFYLVYPDKLESYGFNQGQVELLEEQELHLSDYTTHLGKEVSIGNRYLIFGGGAQKALKDSLYVFDRQTGQINHKVTADYPQGANGQTDQYFVSYTNGEVVFFDTTLKEVGRVVLGESPLTSTLGIYGQAGKVYLVAQDIEQETNTSTNYLYTIDVESFKLDHKTALLPQGESLETMVDSVLVNGQLYLPIVGYTSKDFKTHQPSQEVLVLDPVSGYQEYLTLSTPAPYLTHKTKSQTYLFIEHSSYDLGRLILTVYDLKTGQEQVLDLTDWPHGQGTEGLSIGSLGVIAERYLLLTVADQLFVYDLHGQQLVSQTQLASEWHSALWVVAD